MGVAQNNMDVATMPAERGTVIPNTHTATVPGLLSTQWLDLPMRTVLVLFIEGTPWRYYNRVFIGHRDLTERKPWISYDALMLVYKAVDAARSSPNYSEALMTRAGFYHNHVTLRTHAGRLYAYLKEHQN